MRNLLILAAAFGLTTAANAQNNATTTQNGTSNVAQIEQAGSTNDGTVDQEGNGNFGEIQQSGSGSIALIEQIGDDNGARRYRPGLSSNIVGITDVGDDNNSVIRQIGDDNEAGVNLGIRAERNDVDIDQGTLGEKSYGSVAGVSVGGKDNVVDIDQFGQDQVAGVSIGTALGGRGLSNDVDVLQEGAENESITSIYGSYNTVDVSQDGTLNTATVTFGSPTIGTADSSTATVTQTGDGHMATVTASGSDNMSTITQN